MRWKDEADVIRLANSVEYGHCASVWTRDLTTAHRATRALDAGVVWVNEHLVRPDGMPFGVRKASGIGKEHAIEEIDEYSQEKSIMINLRSDGFTPVMS
jgi:acyl-CoA reductase-like NAD-dependent aldehyde dehydrogenase